MTKKLWRNLRCGFYSRVIGAEMRIGTIYSLEGLETNGVDILTPLLLIFLILLTYYNVRIHEQVTFSITYLCKCFEIR